MKTITLGGKELPVAFDMNAFIEIEEATGLPFSEFLSDFAETAGSGKVSAKKIMVLVRAVVAAGYAAAGQELPYSSAQLGALAGGDIGSIAKQTGDIMQSLVKGMGLAAPKDVEVGEGKAQVG